LAMNTLDIDVISKLLGFIKIINLHKDIINLFIGKATMWVPSDNTAPTQQ
jgi:hypothetical protein